MSTHSVVTTLPLVALTWAAGTVKADLASSQPAFDPRLDHLDQPLLSQVPGQTPMPPVLNPADPASAERNSEDPMAPQRPTSLDLIEQARQRLREKGELPATTPGNLVVPVVPVTPLLPISPALVSPPPSFEPYRLGGGDSIAVVVQRFPDLNFQAAIDQEGNITAPLLGRLSLAGLTIEQAQEKVRQGLNRYVIDPIVYLALTNPRPVLVTLTGEITRPGLYPLPLPRVSAALLTAGGATATADLRSVRVKRSLRDGSTLEEKLDLVTPLKDGSALPDLRLQDGDVVVIPKIEPGTSQDYDRELVARSTLVKPQITVRILSYASGGLGNVTLANGSTFLDALSAARPNPDRIDFRRVALIRFDPVQKKAVSREINARNVLMGDLSQNVALEDNDVIVIGRNLVGKITYALNTFTQPFRDVLGFLLFFRELRGGAANLFGPNNSDDDR
ncbi:polysaccharide biosynthesis/export family protein [Myxacorys almedinensis]